MKRSNKCGLLAAILASLLAIPEAFAADPNIERQASAFLQERYETVVGTRSSILPQLHLGDPKADPDIKHLGTPFYYLIAGLKAVGPQRSPLSEHLPNSFLQVHEISRTQ